MFNFIYRKCPKCVRYAIFLILPIVFVINYFAGRFIGGLLLICTIIAALMLRRWQFLIFEVSCGLIYAHSLAYNQVPPRAAVIQSIIFSAV